MSDGVTTPLISTPVLPNPPPAARRLAYGVPAGKHVPEFSNNNNSSSGMSPTLADDLQTSPPLVAASTTAAGLPRAGSSSMSMATIGSGGGVAEQQYATNQNNNSNNNNNNNNADDSPNYYNQHYGGTDTVSTTTPLSLSPSPPVAATRVQQQHGEEETPPSLDHARRTGQFPQGNLQTSTFATTTNNSHDNSNNTEAGGIKDLAGRLNPAGEYEQENDDDRIPLQVTSSGLGGGDDDGNINHSSSANNNNNNNADNDLYGNGDDAGDNGDDSSSGSPGRVSDETDDNSPGDDKPDEPLEHHVRTNQLFRRAIFSTIPVFMAYAGMITLQRSIKNRIGITDKDKSQSDIFGVAVGSLYLGNLIFRLMHNILFSFLIPRHRVMLSYTLLAASHLIVALAYWVFDSKSVAWTFVSYLLSGVGIGTFESNLLSCLSPLGHATKSWAVIGIPIGFNGVAVGFYIMFAAAPNDPGLHAFPYFLIAGCNLLGLIFFTFFLPYVEFESSHDNAAKFKEDLCRIKEWFPRIQNYCIALAADMFCVSMFSAIVYYIYDLDDIPLWPYAETTIPKNVFQTVYNFCAFMGDFSSRKLAYKDKHKRNPLYFLFFSLLGIVFILSKTAICAPFGMFFVMFANGSIYAHTTKHVDNVVDDRFILVALSLWLFVGDIGSYIASLIVQPLQLWIGGVPVHAVGNMTHHNMTNGTHHNLSSALAMMMMNGV